MYVPIDDSVLPIIPARVLTPSLWEPGKKPTGPVEIDWDNPLTEGLVGCWMFNTGSGNPQNLVSGGLVGTSNWGEQKADYMLSDTPTSTDDLLNLPESPINLTIPAATILTICQPDGVQSYRANYGTLACTKSFAAGGTTAGFSVFWQYYLAEGTIFTNWVRSATYTGTKRINNVVDGRKLVITASTTTGLSPSPAPTHELICNGIVATTQAADYWDFGTGIGMRMSELGGTRGQWSGKQYFYAQWDRTMGLPELADLNADPYQIIKSKGATL